MAKQHRTFSRPLAMIWGGVALLLLFRDAYVAGKRKKNPSAAGDYPANNFLPVQSLLLSVGAFAADLYAIPAVLRNKPAISSGELTLLSPEKVPAYDHVALTQDANNRAANQKISDQLLHGTIAACALLLLLRPFRKDFNKLFLLYAQAHALTYTIYTFSPIGPAFQSRYRPVVYYPVVADDERGRGNNRNSRYSGHTGNAAVATFFMAGLLGNHYFRSSRSGRWLLYALACLPPLSVGCYRVKALKHFPSDVLMAMLIGGTCGAAFPGIYHLRHSENPD